MGGIHLILKQVIFVLFLLFISISALNITYASSDPPNIIELNESYCDNDEQSIPESVTEIDPVLLYNANQLIQNSSTNPIILPDGYKGMEAPIGRPLMPSTGTVKTCVIILEFPDYPLSSYPLPQAQLIADVENKMFSNGNPADYPYESLKNYYQRSSYNQLTITGDVMAIYTASKNKGDYSLDDLQGLVYRIVDRCDDFIDYTQYDNDNDGYIDGLYIFWTGPCTGGFGNAWINNTMLYPNSIVECDGKNLRQFVWVSLGWNNGPQIFNPRTTMHETGHMMGLADYYDYDNQAPKNGVGGCDMMNGAYGDHNCFSKFMLGWLEPTILKIVGVPSYNIEYLDRIALRPSSIYPDAVLIMPSYNGFYGEYFMVEYRKSGCGNDPINSIFNGLAIWHVDATTSDGVYFDWNNQFSSHKRIRLMEADGLEEIEYGDGRADANDFYKPSQRFGSDTFPNSDSYYITYQGASGHATNIHIYDLEELGGMMYASFGFFPPISVGKALDQEYYQINGSNLPMPWTTGGSEDWYGQSFISYDGVDAVQSGGTYNNSSSWLECIIPYDGMLIFKWRVSSEANHDFLKLYINNTLMDSISGETGWITKAIAVNANTSFRWEYTKDASGVAGEDCGWVDQVQWIQTTSLNRALDTLIFNWETGGYQNWYGQYQTFISDTDAAKVGYLNNNSESWLRTTITITDTKEIRFWWKVSSEPYHDYLTFYINGVSPLSGSISGETNWLHMGYILAPGTYTLEWKYTKDSVNSAGQDCAWLDGIQLITPPQADLVVSMVDGPTSGISDGYTSIPVSYTLYNQGESGVSVFKTVFYLSQDTIIDMDDLVISEMLYTSYLGPGESYTGYLNIVPPSNIPSGSYFLGAIIDTENQSDEQNENNNSNCDYEPISIKGTGPSLEESVDNNSLIWINSGNNSWFGQNIINYDLDDAVQSGDIADGQNSQIETTLTGPGSLSFRWAVSSEPNYDYLELWDGINLLERISGNVDWHQQRFDLEAGIHNLKWIYKKDGSISQGLDCGWVDQIVWNPQLENYLDNDYLTWSTGGNNTWYGQSTTNIDGISAAQSGQVVDNQYSELTATVTGTGTLEFWWKVSSEFGGDYLIFYIDGVEMDNMTGDTSWIGENIDIMGPGSHVLKWVYIKNFGISNYSDCGWVDQVNWTPFEPLSLEEALDNNILTYTIGGNGNWYGKNQDGYEALKSGNISNLQQTLFQTTVNGPGTIKFWSKVSSEANFDLLRLYIDDLETMAISGETDWTYYYFHIAGTGLHTLKWIYSKDGSLRAGEDCAWVDQLVFTPFLNSFLDDGSFNWNTGGNNYWFGENTIKHDSVGAAQSGYVTDGQYSEISTTVSGTGFLYFYWKVSSEEYFDYLTFLVDDTEIAKISGETDWSDYGFYLENSGLHTLKWVYSKDYNVTAGQDAGWLDQINWIPFLTSTINESLDNQLLWNTGGNGNWFGQPIYNIDGYDSAKSGSILNNQETWIQTTVNNPGTLSFYWKVSSETNYDYLEIWDGDELLDSISGETGWIFKTFTLESGEHNIIWKYSKDISISQGLDCGWVDQVTWTPSGGNIQLVRTGTYYNTLGEAINQAIDGDTLEVNAGTYTENLTIQHNLNIQAMGEAILQASNPNLPIIEITNTGSGSTIQGFTIIGATSSVGIYLSSANNCNIIDNTISNNFIGIYIQNSYTNTVSINKIENNGWVGICMDNANSNYITNDNEITGNVEGIYLVNTANGNIITGNNIHHNFNAGINILNSSSGNNISGNYAISQNGLIGILIRDSNTNSVSGNTIQTNGWAGMALDNADYNLINGSNNISGNLEGLNITNSIGNTITGNTISGNTNIGISIINNSLGNYITYNNAISNNGIIGVFMRDSESNIVTGNYIQGNGWVGLCFDNATVNTINGSNNISGNLEGLYIVNNSNSNTLSGNNIHDNQDTGIYIDGSTGNQITSNTAISNNGVVGVLFRNANGNTISGNAIEDNNFASIALDNADNNNINGLNTISGSQMGIYVVNGSNANTITDNTLQYNTWAGIVLDGATNTIVYQNNFISNPLQALAQNGSGNSFYQGTTGNYWSDWPSSDPRPIPGNENLYDQYPFFEG